MKSRKSELYSLRQTVEDQTRQLHRLLEALAELRGNAVRETDGYLTVEADVVDGLVDVEDEVRLERGEPSVRELWP